MFKPALLIGLTFLSSAFLCQKSNSKDKSEITESLSFELNQELATQDLRTFTESPHVFGSERQNYLAQYVLDQLQLPTSQKKLQPFSAETPNPNYQPGSPRPMTLEQSGQNILAWLPIGENSCVTFLGSHYDTKRTSGFDYLGANDSGSSSVLLIHLVNYLANLDMNQFQPNCHIMSVWFDGEEAVLDNWTDGETLFPKKIKDNTYGSRFFVSELTNCNSKKCFSWEGTSYPADKLILIDMVGSQNLKLSLDSNSTPRLIVALQNFAKAVGIPTSSYKQSIEDDHIPFLEAGIPAVNIIDFNNTQHWHKPGDDFNTISLDSMEKTGNLVLSLINE